MSAMNRATMQPLASMPRETAARIHTVLSDIDDTITTHGKLTPEAYASLEAMQRAGLRVVLVTGRPAGWCDPLARMWPVDAVIGEHGAFYMWFDAAGRKLHTRHVMDEATRLANTSKLAAVRERIVREGPLRSQDFEHEGARDGSSAWWGWKPQKAALEYLWHTGELLVVRREKFQKVYDLTARVLPDLHGAPAPSEEEHTEWACSTAMERLVVATPKELSEFWA